MSKAFKTDPESFGNLALSPWITWASVSPLPKLLLCVSIWTQTQQERLQSVFPSASNHKVDLIFESRIGCGVSSYIISKVLPNVQIRTFDLNDDRLIASKHSASSFLQDFCHNVETHVGDSLVLIPEYLEQFERGTVAILIDGPKGQIACDFAFRLLTSLEY